MRGRIAAVAATIAWVAAASVAAHAGPLTPTQREAATRLLGAALASDHAYLRLQELCDDVGHRIAGSEALDHAVTWAAAAMRADSLDTVRLQPAMVPRWVRGDERAELIAPYARRLHMLGLGRSVGTPRGGITADVVAVGSFGELDSLPAGAVRGKIVLYDVPFASYSETVRYRSNGANRAAARGAVAVLVRSVGPVSLATPHTGAMAAYTDTIPHIPGAAVAIEDATLMHRLLDRGIRVRVRLTMGARTLPDVVSHNVIGELRGATLPEEIVVVGGHLDSWDVGQGANDDGGGCVIAMEALRLLRTLNLRPRRTVRCVLWTNEEYGTRGGRAYADSAHARGERHVAAIESDGGVERLAGFGVTVRRAGTETTDSLRTARAREQIREIVDLLRGLGRLDVAGYGAEADTDPLLTTGVPGVSHRTTMEHYFHWHHTDADTFDKIDRAEIRQNAAALAVLVYLLADGEEPLGGR